MILLEIKEYIQSQKSVSLTDLALHFNLPAEVIADMMLHWVNKGVIEKTTLGCGGCGKSCESKPIYYHSVSS